MGREDMQALIEDAKKGYFKTVIFSSLSRFSRNTADALTFKELLVDALGIRMISVEENLDSDIDKDNMKFILFSMMNEKYAHDISLSARRGIRMSAKKGNFTGSIAPFGYKKVQINNRKTLEIVDKHAAIVRKIFELYINENMGEKKITNFLNDYLIPSPKGGVWGITTIQRILQNEAYTGRNVYSKYTVKKVYEDLNNLQNRKRKLVQKDPEKWERNDNKNWDEIIPDEMFRKAQEIRFKRSGGKRGNGVHTAVVNPLAGIIKCFHCGSNFVSMKSGKKGKDGKEYRYLICSTRRRKGVSGCENGLWIPLESYMDELIRNTKEKLAQFISVINIEEKIEKELNDSKHRPVVEIKPQKMSDMIEEEILKNRRYLFSLRKDLKNNEIDEEQFEFEKEETEKEIEKLQKQLKLVQPVEVKDKDEELIRSAIT